MLRAFSTTDPWLSTAGRKKRSHRAPGVTVKMPWLATTLTVDHNPIADCSPSSSEPCMVRLDATAALVVQLAEICVWSAARNGADVRVEELPLEESSRTNCLVKP